MNDHVAIVTGGLRGLGRAMALGLLDAGYRIVAHGHIESDLAEFEAAVRERGLGDRAIGLAGDLRAPSECDRLVAETVARFGKVDILINNAGLTFTYIAPDRSTRPRLPLFWELSEEVCASVMQVNFRAAESLARQVAPGMVARGWGRIINVTTRLSTMNRSGAFPYGTSKAALEMGSEIWAKDAAGTGMTVNILNPGAGANTEGLDKAMRDASLAGRAPPLTEPAQMVAPLLWLVSREADAINGYRFDAISWDTSMPPAEAALKNGRPAGFVLHPADGPGRSL